MGPRGSPIESSGGRKYGWSRADCGTDVEFQRGGEILANRAVGCGVCMLGRDLEVGIAWSAVCDRRQRGGLYLDQPQWLQNEFTDAVDGNGRFVAIFRRGIAFVWLLRRRWAVEFGLDRQGLFRNPC